MNKLVLSKEAAATRNAYYRERGKKTSPEKTRQYNVAKWENAARKFYGKNYCPPLPDEEMSEQALEMRRRYQRHYRKTHAEACRKYQSNYRKKHPEKVRQYYVTYWERKSRTATVTK